MSDLKASKPPVVITLTMEPDMLPKIEERTRSLDINRSQYVRKLIREDLARTAAVPQPKAAEALAA